MDRLLKEAAGRRGAGSRSPRLLERNIRASSAVVEKVAAVFESYWNGEDFIAYAFGELWVDRERPRLFEHVFASIQSLNASGLDNLDSAHFDVVIVDEFHHAAASSYRALLGHVRPAELLGLTATPERSDGLPVLDWFDGRIAAELRLWDAIDQHRLVPFTVLDFIGHHRSEFRFDRRLRALLNGTRHEVATQVEQAFPFLPAGCHMELPLATFLGQSGLDLEDLYQGGKSWSDLCEDAGLPIHPRGPQEETLRRACGRLLHIDNQARIDAYQRLLLSEAPPVRRASRSSTAGCSA